MAFDGITIANLVYDLNQKIVSGRIAKIAQPEKDELLLTIKGNRRISGCSSQPTPASLSSTSLKPISPAP